MWNDNYFEFVHCWNKTYLISRKNNAYWYRLPWSTHLWSYPKVELLETFTTRMSHNMATFCFNNSKLLVVGGQERKNWHRMAHFSGLWYAYIDKWADLRNTTNMHLIDAANCKEGRPKFPVCEFDGKVSIAVVASQVFVFVRQNVDIGHRWVQVTSGRIQGTRIADWTPYRSVNVKDYTEKTMSMYFMHVERWNSTHHLGLFPAVNLKKTMPSGIFASFSSTLYDWSTPRLVRAFNATNGRVDAYPIGLNKGKVVAYIREGVNKPIFNIDFLTGHKFPESSGPA